MSGDGALLRKTRRAEDSVTDLNCLLQHTAADLLMHHRRGSGVALRQQRSVASLDTRDACIGCCLARDEHPSLFRACHGKVCEWAAHISHPVVGTALTAMVPNGSLALAGQTTRQCRSARENRVGSDHITVTPLVKGRE